MCFHNSVCDLLRLWGIWEGCILIRKFGTKPIVCVMVWVPDYDICQMYINEVVNVICEKRYKR